MRRLRSSWLVALTALLAVVMGEGGCGGEGGASSSASSTGSGGGPPFEPDCRGVPMPAGDVALGADGRSIALACKGFSLDASLIEDGIARLQYRGSGPLSDRPSYAVISAPQAPVSLLLGSTPEVARLCTPELFIEIDRASCRVHATLADGTVILHDPEDGGYIEIIDTGPEDRLLARAAAPGERFYGFGERTGPLDKRGKAMVFWNTDAYQDAFGGYPPDADPLYQSIPFFIGLRAGAAYGVFLDSTHRLRFDMAASDPSVYSLAAEGGALDHYLLAGPSMKVVVERYTRLTGRMPLPPRFSLGYHQSRWGYSPDAAVLGVAQELRSRAIPADTMWLDIQHMDGFRSFTWDPAAFPDPQGLTAALASMGFRTIAIVDPAIKVDPGWDVYDAGLAGGFFLQQNGQPYVGEVWPGASVFPDFSDPGARAWWSSLVQRPLAQGVEGLWIDMNEPSNFTMGAGGTVPKNVPAAGDGFPGTMGELHNVYGLNEARATYEGMRAKAPGKRPFILSRAGYSGIQRYAAVWTGDAPSTWATLDTTLPMMLGMGLSGVPFIGSDVGGYSGGATPELFARWMQVGSFSPFFRAHVQTSAAPQEPWQFGTEVEDVSRKFIEERYRLLPYLYSLFYEASTTGAPVLRPLVYEMQGDEAAQTIDDEALLGPWLLYAPVLQQGAASRDVYLPPGRWFEYGSGAVFEGPETITADLTLGALPLYVREGAIVPKGPVMAWSEEAPVDPLSIDLYPSDKETTFSLYEDDGASFAGDSSLITYSLVRSATGAAFTASARTGTFAPPQRPLVLRVRRVDHGVTAVRLDGQPLAAFTDVDALNAAGKGYLYDDRDLSALVVIPDKAGFSLELDYDPSLTAPAPPVLMPFEVTVPPGTPAGSTIHIATSANGWTHAPLGWVTPGVKAAGLVSVPRGPWVFYKYTRGDWSTVEKWPGCVEATNRYERGAAWPVKRDTVYQWADACP